MAGQFKGLVRATHRGALKTKHKRPNKWGNGIYELGRVEDSHFGLKYCQASVHQISHSPNICNPVLKILRGGKWNKNEGIVYGYMWISWEVTRVLRVPWQYLRQQLRLQILFLGANSGIGHFVQPETLELFYFTNTKRSSVPQFNRQNVEIGSGCDGWKYIPKLPCTLNLTQ